VIVRHAASNQLQRNAPHCKPPAAPKRPPDRSQTAPAPAFAYPALRLAITDEASLFALLSTHLIRGQQCAEAPLDPAERPSSCRRDPISRSKAASPPSLHGLSSAAGAVHKNTVGRPSTRSLGVVAQKVRMPAAPSSPCPRPRPASGVRVRCPVRATSVHACLSTGPVSSVRCGRLSIQVSAVRCPGSGEGVRCLCVAARAVSGRSEVLERGVGRPPYGWDGRGRRGRPLGP
jgi:hypothetical protein